MTLWNEVEDMQKTLRQIATDVSVLAADRQADMEQLHKSFCNTLDQRLRPLMRARRHAPEPAIPAPSLDDVRQEILKMLDSQPRYAFNTTKGSRKWHKLYKEFEGETPLLMKARCGFKCGGNVAVEVYRTLGTGDRCSKCFPPDDGEET